MAAKQWDAAEETLSAALKAAEASAGDAAPLLAPVLACLGTVYARSARVMYAKASREAAKLARLDPCGWPSRRPRPCCTPACRRCSRRHCQLLSALPNRGGEADSGAAQRCSCGRARGAAGAAASAAAAPALVVAAVAAAAAAADRHAALEAVLGDRGHRTGKGGHGGTWVISLLACRLACWP